MTLVVVSVIEDLVICSRSEEELPRPIIVRRRKPLTLNPTPRIRDKYVMPAMIILQLDLTIWPFMVDMQVTLPVFKTEQKDTIVDPTGRLFTLYPDIPELLDNLERRWIKLAAVSQSTNAERVETLLEKFNLQQYFVAWEIMPGPKTLHVKRLHELTNLPYEEMLYIDSDTADIPAIRDLNVTCYLLQEEYGLTLEEMEEAFFDFYRMRPTPIPITPSRRRRASRASRRKTTTNPHTRFVQVDYDYSNGSISLSSESVND